MAELAGWVTSRFAGFVGWRNIEKFYSKKSYLCGTAGVGAVAIQDSAWQHTPNLHGVTPPLGHVLHADVLQGWEASQRAEEGAPADVRVTELPLDGKDLPVVGDVRVGSPEWPVAIPHLKIFI